MSKHIKSDSSYSLSGMRKKCAVGRRSCRRFSLTTHYCWQLCNNLEVVVETAIGTDEHGRCEREVSDDSSSEDAGVDATGATMRASCMSFIRVDVQHAVK